MTDGGVNHAAADRYGYVRNTRGYGMLSSWRPTTIQ